MLSPYACSPNNMTNWLGFIFNFNLLKKVGYPKKKKGSEHIFTVNVYYVMGFRPSYSTCIAHLYLYYTLLIPHTHASYIRHWCIFSHYEIQYKSSNISNMVSEPLLWHFLSSLVFISVTRFSTSLLPSQQPPQPFAIEPPTSSSHRPWVPDLQPPSLRSFTLHRLLPFASPLQTLLRLLFWSYHRDHLASIYKTVKDSTSSETAHAPTHR